MYDSQSNNDNDVTISIGNKFVSFSPFSMFTSSSKAREVIYLWLILCLVIVPSGMLTRWFELTGMEVVIGNITVNLTLYIPMIFCVLLVIWLGFWWAAIPAYLSSFFVALIGGMPIEWIFIFAFANPIGLAIFAMFYRVTPMRTDLRDVESLVGFIMISLVASLAGSIGALIWALTNDVGLNVAHPVWLGWWLGGWIQAIFLVGPLLYIFGSKAESYLSPVKDSQLDVKNSRGALLAMIIAFIIILVGFVSAGRSIAIQQVSNIDWQNGGMMNLEQAQNTVDSLSYPLFILLTVMCALGYLAYRATLFWHSTMQGVNEKLSENNKQLVDMVNRDPLSGLFNRRKVFEQLNQDFTRSQRVGDSVCVIMVDADRFKSVNDNFGHLVGDEVIKLIANCINKFKRDYDMAGRYGGEEFILVLPNTQVEQATSVAERIRAELGKLVIETDQGPLKVTVSLGVTANMPEDEKIEQIIERADKALLVAKENGRNQVVVG